MKYSYTFKTVIVSLGVNRLRSSLTILGIVIGITAIIVVMSLGHGARRLILGQLQGLGSRTMFVVPGKDTQGPGFSAMFVDSLKDRELDAIKKKSNVPTLQDITPLLIIPGSVSHNSAIFQPTTVGSAPELQEILDMPLAQGVFINSDDIVQKTLTMVIGSNVAEKLFGDASMLGEKIVLKQKKFRVIGVLGPKGRVGLFNVDDMAIVPYATAQNQLLGKKHYDEFIARARQEGEVERTVFDISATLRELHGITDPKDDDFHIHTQADIAARVGAITGILTILLVSVAGISLIVGGIGIMNIMLVSVTERTREIGLRKALGARNKDILLQFLFEAVVLTSAGGAAGIILGAFISVASVFVFQKFFHLAWSFSFPVSGALIGISVSLLIGLIFGLYPAQSAAKKSPLEALRYE